jgi:hypothetical protein
MVIFMDLDVISFPALVVADDGWVQQIDSKEALSALTRAALRKYSKRRVILYDSRDRAWQIDGFEPLQHENAVAKLLAVVSNRKVPVRTSVKPITESPLQVTRDALAAAIDADDDILTQVTKASELKSAIDQAHSFEALIDVLKAKRAI